MGMLNRTDPHPMFEQSWLNKSRRPFQSAIELLSPLLLISLLACAFNQSSVISYAAQNYAELSYSFPGDFTGLMDIASGHGKCKGHVLMYLVSC